MNELYLTNTLQRRKERFVPADPKRVTLYQCGPTVYNYTHIGNARPPVVFDVLYRLLRRLYGDGHVLFARNFTDIDDRIIAKAAETGEPMDALTERFARVYDADNAALNVLPPTFAPRATQYVDAMIDFIALLIEKGAAYRAESGVYFSVAADADYGKLSGRAQEDLRAGARVEGEEDKRAPSDFALWKAAREGEPAWDAPFGRGRPGWHIECSAMIKAVLGETIDIHAGGQDLIFPHHENEIAQSETAHGHALARYWVHNGFVTMDAEKMSKSLGNVVLTHDLLKKWPGEALRYALLSAHYRAPLDFNEALLKQAKASLDRMYNALARADVEPAPDTAPPAAFIEALCDDLNTPKALAELAAMTGALNSEADKVARARIKGALIAAGDLIGLLQADPAAWLRGAGDDSAEIDALVAARTEARRAKDFARADAIRADLAARGVEIMDGPQGATWRRL